MLKTFGKSIALIALFTVAGCPMEDPEVRAPERHEPEDPVFQEYESPEMDEYEIPQEEEFEWPQE